MIRKGNQSSEFFTFSHNIGQQLYLLVTNIPYFIFLYIPIIPIFYILQQYPVGTRDT